MCRGDVRQCHCRVHPLQPCDRRVRRQLDQYRVRSCVKKPPARQARPRAAVPARPAAFAAAIAAAVTAVAAVATAATAVPWGCMLCGHCGAVPGRPLPKVGAVRVCRGRCQRRVHRRERAVACVAGLLALR